MNSYWSWHMDFDLYVVLEGNFTWHCPNRSKGCNVLTSRLLCHCFSCCWPLHRSPWEFRFSEEDCQGLHRSCCCHCQESPRQYQQAVVCKHLYIQQLSCRTCQLHWSHQHHTCKRKVRWLKDNWQKGYQKKPFMPENVQKQIRDLWWAELSIIMNCQYHHLHHQYHHRMHY